MFTPTKVVCTDTVYASVSGIQTSSIRTTTQSNVGSVQAQIPITAGAEKLPSGAPTCTAAPRNAAPGFKSIPKIAGFGAMAVVLLALL